MIISEEAAVAAEAAPEAGGQYQVKSRGGSETLKQKKERGYQ